MKTISGACAAAGARAPAMTDPAGQSLAQGMELGGGGATPRESEPGTAVPEAPSRPHGLMESLRNAYYASAVYPLTLTGT